MARDAHEQLKNIDLNLLVPLAVLLEEQHVTRAAGRLGMSQAGMSRALGRLRDTFGDPLLVRTPKGMCRSAVADAMMVPLQEVLNSARSLVFENRTFDPSISGRTFTLVFDGYLIQVLLPLMLERIAVEAPGIRFRIVSRGPGVHERLASGHLDLLLDLGGIELPGLRQQRVLEERVVVIARDDHPVFDTPFELRTFAQYPSVVIDFGEGRTTPQEADLKSQGLTRVVACRMPSFHGVPEAVVARNAVAVFPYRMAVMAAQRLPIGILEVPLWGQSFGLFQVWHESTQGDAGHAWLRALVKDCCAGIDPA